MTLPLDSTNPKHPQFASYDDRFRTFETWPVSAMTQTKETLAAAGFFHTGDGDQTLCYHCGLGLKNWEPDDVPWILHARWLSACDYLLSVKGQEYVDTVNGKYVNEQTRKRLFSTDTITRERSAGRRGEDDEECYPGPSSRNSNFESTGLCESESSESNRSSTLQFCKSDSHSEPTADDARMCKICYNRELRKVFMPCGHLVACAECAKDIKICAVCREPVTQTVRVIFS